MMALFRELFERPSYCLNEIANYHLRYHLEIHTFDNRVTCGQSREPELQTLLYKRKQTWFNDIWAAKGKIAFVLVDEDEKSKGETYLNY